MKYALLITEDPTAHEGRSDDERAAITAEYLALRRDERAIAGEHLEGTATATTVRVSDGETLLTDGPFAETKEFLGGFYIVEVANLDAALEFAARNPAARFGGAVEVRPVMGH